MTTTRKTYRASNGYVYILDADASGDLTVWREQDGRYIAIINERQDGWEIAASLFQS